MSEWRPDGWFDTVHHRPDEEGDDGVYESDWDDGYEVGADAMLAALRAGAGRHHISPSDNDIPCKLPELWPGQTGYVIFIPDKE